MNATPVSAREAARWIADGEAVLVDVRSAEEFRAGHVAAALSLPLDTLPGALDALQLPAGRKLVFQCQRGARGEAACVATEGTGRARYNLEGGLDAWRAAGLPVIGEGAAALPLFRQVQIAVGSIVLALVLAGFLVAPAFFALAGAIGFMLALAGVTGWCGMALLLQRAPWNRPA
ncbi:rhodanese-like domain-containing protein [Amaricoccus sp.]|uniref:rhodanese-like domain-containing protein n=1 Tax=Amaricoccus sp. TaxID=1872485 RepID=UPI001B45D826|nr:rhodanese-like domain-containing protein [Amaricoccus sp.]MBP7002725.1 rhodanese-like domain-containing protein [Amaricoccus sp.]